MTTQISKARDPAPDVLRGFALLGIIMVNLAFFSNDPSEGIGKESMSGIVNSIAGFLVFTLFEGKFFLIFSFLFGYSSHYIIGHNGKNTPRWIRRAVVLIIFGALHFSLLWHGDILFLYGSLGLILTLFFKRSDKFIKIWATSIYATFSLFMILLALLAQVYPEPIKSNPIADAFTQVMQSGGYLDSIPARIDIWTQTIALELLIQGAPVFVAFLLGLLAARKSALSSGSKVLRLDVMTKYGLGLGLPIQVLAGIIFTVNENSINRSESLYFWMLVLSLIFAPLLSMGYIGLILKQLEKSNQWLMQLSFPGRMSLTNYIFQSLVLSLIYGPWGLGLYQKIEFWISFLIAILIWFSLLLISKFWLTGFSKGPAEWLLGRLTQKSRRVALDRH
jgi:uncharacterized protein